MILISEVYMFRDRHIREPLILNFKDIPLARRLAEAILKACQEGEGEK
jgi:hypothetical protein